MQQADILEVIYTALLTLRGYCGVLASNRDFYRNTSRQHLIPLFKTMYEIPLNPSSGDKEAATKALADHTSIVAEDIQSQGREVRKLKECLYGSSHSPSASLR